LKDVPYDAPPLGGITVLAHDARFCINASRVANRAALHVEIGALRHVGAI